MTTNSTTTHTTTTRTDDCGWFGCDLPRHHSCDHIEDAWKRAASTDITEAQFVREALYTDTRVWEIIRRTASTVTLRSTRRTDNTRQDMAADEGAYGVRPVFTEVQSNPDGMIVTARRRADGKFYMPGSNRVLRPVFGTPEEYTDYRL